MIVCGGYYYFWMHVLPKWKHYTIRSQVLDIDDNGANTHRLVRVPNAELDEWDATHDELGRLRRRTGNGVVSSDPTDEEREKGGSPSESVSKV